jgi:hypothetical protein
MYNYALCSIDVQINNFTNPRFHLGLLSRSARYCVSHSTPIGVAPGFTWGYYLAPLVTAFHIQPLSGLPQVSLGAIISLRSLLRFTFNPYRGCPRFHLGLLSRSARYCVSHSTPIGVALGFTRGYFIRFCEII